MVGGGRFREKVKLDQLRGGTLDNVSLTRISLSLSVGSVDRSSRVQYFRWV